MVGAREDPFWNVYLDGLAQNLIEEAAEAARVARLTPAQRAAEARRAAAEKAAWNAGAEERAETSRRVMAQANSNYAAFKGRREAGRAAVAAARTNLNASRAAAANRFGSLRGNNRGTQGARGNNRRTRGNNRGSARLPPGKMARECKTSNVAHAHGTTGAPCKFMHKDEAGFELLRNDQKRNGPPKGGRKSKRSTRKY